MWSSKLIIASIGILFLTGSCKKIPDKKINQLTQTVSYEVINDSLKIFIDNPVHCPLRINTKTNTDSISRLLNQDFPFVLPPKSDTSFYYPGVLSDTGLKISFFSTLGNPADSIIAGKIELPFPAGKTYKIIQGYNGRFSHRSDMSRNAIDFSLQVGDTICAAADAFVVGVIEDYRYGGKSKKWRDYANFITLFHPERNIFTQYVHLTKDGSLVEVGDTIKAGQPIAISGKTGFTSTPHLHFNVLVASEKGISSYPIEFKEGFPGKALIKGELVTK